jgi:hypothetical protein
MTPDQIVEALGSTQDERQPTLVLCASEATRQQVMRGQNGSARDHCCLSSLPNMWAYCIG